MNYNKKNVTKLEIDPLCNKYGISPLLASILVRRGITKGSDIFYYLEDDIRFEHSPFLFNQMEDAVDRILEAKEEGEKILIFGDRDVDGITSTAILYKQLKRMGLDVSWRLPVNDDAYGLSIEAVDDFAKENGTLIITVDCGISNAVEIEHAAELGINVIVTDHHNPPDIIPDEAIAIIDPKCEDSGYPFDGISGAAVAYKLVSALQFSQSNFYNSEVCILDVQPTNDGRYEITCAKIRNLTKSKEIKETIIPDRTSISETRLPTFLSGQYIYVWDNKKTCQILKELFGSGIDFNFLDLKSEVSKIWSSFKTKDSKDLLTVSKSAKYADNEVTISDSLINLFVTYVNAIENSKNKSLELEKQENLQLVGIAALADIMPLQNENRLFVKNAIKSISQKNPMPGLAELFSKLGIDFHSATIRDLGWSVIPALNAAGRLGQSNISLELLISENPEERKTLASKIIELNENRKQFVNDASIKTSHLIKESFHKFNEKLCVILDPSIHKGITGLLANRIMNTINVPVICMTEVDNVYSGSMRCCRGIVATEFLKSFGDFFLAYGGHDAAAGFSFEKSKLDDFYKKTLELSSRFNLAEPTEIIDIDAELPAQYLTSDILEIVDMFEPYGNGNDELIFLSQNLPVADAMIVGKKEPTHLKLILDCGKYKFPCMYWEAGHKFKSEIDIGNNISVLFTITKNIYNGIVTPQMVVKELIVNK